MKASSFTACAAAAASLLLVGCVADRVKGLRAPGTHEAPGAAGPGPACAFTIKSIDDRREDKNLGILFRTKVDSDDFTSWFADGMAAIPGQTKADAATSLQIDVLKAYIQSIGTMKSANLVVKVTTSGAGGVQRQSTFRGVDNSINWNNTQDEVQGAFNTALADLQRQIGAHLKQHCNS